MSKPIVRIHNAHKYYNRGKSNEIHVMNNVNLELPEAGMVAVFGRSGCGKTTLLTTVGGLDSIAKGSIELFGQNIRRNTDTLRNKYVGYIFQNYNLNERETVFENVAAALRLCGMEDAAEIRTRTMAALRNVDMDKYRDRTPDTLSGGQQQRVAIARALVKSPAIILADEPTGNLDEENTVLVMDILKELSRTRLVLLVTHEADLVDHYCDRVIEIVDGRVTGDRTNREANGYVQRSKNDIYLGELKKQTTSTPGATVEYYGEAGKEITLRLVNYGGRLYLKSSDPTVMLLDDRSEVQLVEGVFNETPTEETKPRRTLDLSALTPFEGKHFGRLFRFKTALAAAWRENFSSKKKAGRVLLSICLILLSMTLVTMSAVVGTGLESFLEIRRDHNDSRFYIPLDPEASYDTVLAGMGSNGMDSSMIVNDVDGYDQIPFRTSSFITAKSSTVQVLGRIRDVAKAGELTAVAGKSTVERSGDVLITTAVADEILTEGKVSYLTDYEDLVGMVSLYSQYSMNDVYLRIAGVVRSNEKDIYVSSMDAATHVMRGVLNYVPVLPASQTYYGKDLRDGEILRISDEYTGTSLRKGDTFHLLGQSFTVADDLFEYTGVGQFPTFVADVYGTNLSADSDAYAETHGIPKDVAVYARLLEEYLPCVTDFSHRLMAARNRQGISVDFAVWALSEKGSVGAFAELMGEDPVKLCAAYLYHAENGSYPTEDQLAAFLKDTQKAGKAAEMADISVWEKEYESFNNYYGGAMYYYYYVVTDADYVRLASSVGKTDVEENIYMMPYSIWNGFGGTTYSNHLMINSSDVKATEAFLTEHLGDDGFLSPDEVLRDSLQAVEILTLVGFVGIATVLALMCLCMYFIMHAIFVGRIREVGILRAIGVTKKNILFRFFVEALLVSALTVVTGFGLSTWMVSALLDTPLFSEFFFYPPWMAVILFVLLVAASLIFGILPAVFLLRKTPAAILSKYDI